MFLRKNFLLVMNKILTAFVLCFMFIGFNQIAAQPSIFLDPDFVLVDENDIVSVDITTNDFTAIQEIRFTLEYDEEVLLYNSATFNAALNFAGGCSVTANNATEPARLTVECILDADCNQSPATEVTLPDGELIVTLNFTAINGYTDISVIDDINDPDDHYVQRICNDIGLIVDDPSTIAVDNLPVTVNVPDVNANSGEQICLDFSLLDFEDIISMQYTISWDASVLEFVDVDGYNLPGISGDNFNLLPSQDALVFAWNEPTTQGTSVSDGTNFTQICFNVVGDCNDVSTIQIQGLPTPVEITNVDDPGQDIGYLNGVGTVTVNCNNPDGLGINLNTPLACINPSESFEVCAEISNFVDLEEFAFTLNWNSSALQLDGVTFPSGLAGFGNAQVDATLSGQGLLGVSWTDPSCNGVNLADGVDLLCMDFTSVGSGGVNSSIYVTGDVDPINVTTECGGSDNLGVNAVNGLVEICVPTGITISASDFEVDPGDQICVPIEVQDFTDVESFAFSVAWDNSVLDYVSTQNSAIGGIVFDESLTLFGSLCAQWTGVAPETLNDGTALFEICFEANGAPFSCSDINFPQFPCEQNVVTSESGGFSVDVNAQNGEVCMVNPAALNIDIANANGFPGDNVCIDFTVNNFVNLSNVSFSIEWDNTVLEYTELINPGSLPNFDGSSYSDNNAGIGVVGVNWQSINANGNSLSNNTSIFSLCFNPIGGSGECADITITSTFENILVTSAFGGGDNLGLDFNEGEVCIEQFVSISDSFITPASCENTADGSVEITPTGGSNTYNFEWFDSNNLLVASTEDLINAFSGDYTLVISDNINPSIQESFSFTIGLGSNAPIANAGGDFTMPCDSPFKTVDASLSSQGNYSYEWTDLGSTSNVFPTNVLNPQIAGAGEFQLAVTDNTTGCTVTDVITVTSVVLPASAVSFADQDSILNCLVNTVNLSSETSSNFDDPNILYIWSTDGGLVDPATKNDQSISTTVAGTYYLEVFDAGTSCFSIDTIEVLLDVTAPTVNAGNDISLDCDNPVSILNGSGTDLGPNLTYEWYFENGDFISSSLIVTNNISVPGMYTLTALNNDNGCAATDTVIITSDTDLPLVDLGSNLLQLDCNNPTISIDASAGSSVGPEFVYTWFKNGVDMMQSGTSIDVTVADTYELMILNTNNNCDQTASVIVSDSTAAPTLPVLTSGSISCDVASTVIENDLDDQAHYSFAWTGPAVDPITATDPVTNVNLYGEYNVLVTNTNTGCIVNETIIVPADTIVSVINNLTLLDGNPSNILTCDDMSLTYLLELDDDDDSDFNIIWSGPGINASDEYEPVLSEPGMISVFYENNLNGCIDTLSIEVQEDKDEPIVNGITTDVSEWGCDNTIANLEVITDISTVGDYVYNWAAVGCNNITITNNGNTAAVTGPCVFEAIIVNPANGCDITESVNIVDIRETPDVVVDFESITLNCNPDEVDISGSSSTPNAVFEWSFGGDPIGASSLITVTEVGEYILTITDPANNCQNNASTMVDPAELPTVSAGSNVEFGCLATSVELQGSSTDDVTYAWSGPCVDNVNVANPNVECPGIYNLIVTDITTNCVSEDSTEVILVYDIDFADASFSSDPCVTEEVQLDGNIPANGVTGLWVIEPATAVIDDPTAQNILIFDLDPGTYTAMWTLSTDNCPEYSSSEVSFDVLSAPEANDDEIVIDDSNPFAQIDLLDNDDILTGYTYEVTVNGTPGVGEFIVSNSEVEYTPTPLLFDGSFDLTYELCLEGCENLCSEAALNIIINRTVDANAEFPNSITPNGDGLNDEFIFDILSSSPDKYPDNSMIIFNRWGDIVFQSAPYTNNWTGQNDRGQDLPEGTYYYVLELDVANGVILNGSITILR